MKPIKHIIVLFFIFVLGCTNNQNKSSNIDVNGCKKQCYTQAKSCLSTCQNSCSKCRAKSQKETRNSYIDYVKEKCIEGGTIARELNSYRDPLQCRKTTCDCRADYEVCRQACTGSIHK